MKKFREFKSQQQVINEIGPVGATIAAAIGIGTGAAWLYKQLKKFKGYRESQKEKKSNKENGYEIELKTLNPATGKEETIPYFIDPKKPNPGNDDLAKMGVNIKNYDKPNNDEISKIEKEAGADVKRFGAKVKGRLHRGEPVSDDDLPGNMLKLKKDTEGEKDDDTATANTSSPETTDDADERERDSEGNLKNQKDAQAEFEKSKFKKAPDGWAKDPDDKKKVITKAEADEKKKTKKNKKDKLKKDPKKTKALGGDIKPDPKKKKQAPAGIESKLLKFGEFIKEDVMKDMKKISKSKKDMEIKLDDGTEIPIDPMTAEIFVKYIEGLKSSEQRKVINQIQRTERGFMKVLGKAHGE
jgi:hypothetical protein